MSRKTEVAALILIRFGEIIKKKSEDLNIEVHINVEIQADYFITF